MPWLKILNKIFKINIFFGFDIAPPPNPHIFIYHYNRTIIILSFFRVHTYLYI